MCVCVCLGRLPNHGEVLGCGGGRGEGRVDAGKHGWVCVEQWNDGQSSRVCSSIILKKGLAAQLCNLQLRRFACAGLDGAATRDHEQLSHGELYVSRLYDLAS